VISGTGARRVRKSLAQSIPGVRFAAVCVSLDLLGLWWHVSQPAPIVDGFFAELAACEDGLRGAGSRDAGPVGRPSRPRPQSGVPIHAIVGRYELPADAARRIALRSISEATTLDATTSAAARLGCTITVHP
jgi:hypothetical protein